MHDETVNQSLTVIVWPKARSENIMLYVQYVDN